MIDYTEYKRQFEKVLSGEWKDAPYNDDRFVEYVKLNRSRTKRWERTGELSPEIKHLISSISDKQDWIVITEPWCGDAAHIVPFIAKMAELNDKISLKIQNRDSEGSEIDNYLTNGSRSIPKLIVRDATQNDLFDWGPRPSKAQEIHFRQKNEEHKDQKEKKAELQEWYNNDKGRLIQHEIAEQLSKVI